MMICSKCGAENAPGGKYCARCEMPLPHSGVGDTLTGNAKDPRLTLPGAGGDSTLAAPRNPDHPAVAGAPTRVATPARFREPKEPEARAAKGKPGLQQTLLGVAPQFALSPAAAPQERRGADAGQRTLIGVPPQGSGAEPATAHTHPNISAAAARESPGAAPAAAGGAFQPVRTPATILGGTIPIERPQPSSSGANSALQPQPDEARTTATAPKALEQTALAPPDASGLPRQPAAPVKTALGVALPGIAPLRPGVAAAPPPVPPTRPQLEATQLQPDAMTSTAFGAAGSPRIPRSALVLLISGAVLLISAGLFAVLWKGSSPLSAVVSADPSGKDRIDIVCQSCPDGARISLGDAHTEVHQQKAYLLLEQALPLGQNELRFGLELPGASERKTVAVTLPALEYRIQPDTSGLSGDPPSLTLRLQALPGSSAIIGGQAIALDASGQGEVAIDVKDQLVGPATEIVTFDRAVPYAISAPSGKRHEGELKVKIAVTPLMVEAPGSDTVTDGDRFMLAGRTTKGAEIWVAGSPLSVSSAGRFAQLMSIDSVGETHVTVRALQAGLAPRFVSFRLRRVADLRAELDALKNTAVPLSKVTSDVDAHVGHTVWASGKVEQVRIDGHRTVLMLTSDQDCGGRLCLARLLYGGLRKVERGAKVSAVGRVVRKVGAGPESAPEIEVSLLR